MSRPRAQVDALWPTLVAHQCSTKTATRCRPDWNTAPSVAVRAGTFPRLSASRQRLPGVAELPLEHVFALCLDDLVPPLATAERIEWRKTATSMEAVLPTPRGGASVVRFTVCQGGGRVHVGLVIGERCCAVVISSTMAG